MTQPLMDPDGDAGTIADANPAGRKTPATPTQPSDVDPAVGRTDVDADAGPVPPGYEPL